MSELRVGKIDTFDKERGTGVIDQFVRRVRFEVGALSESLRAALLSAPSTRFGYGEAVWYSVDSNPWREAVLVARELEAFTPALVRAYVRRLRERLELSNGHGQLADYEIGPFEWALGELQRYHAARGEADFGESFVESLNAGRWLAGHGEMPTGLRRVLEAYGVPPGLEAAHAAHAERRKAFVAWARRDRQERHEELARRLAGSGIDFTVDDFGRVLFYESEENRRARSWLAHAKVSKRVGPIAHLLHPGKYPGEE